MKRLRHHYILMSVTMVSLLRPAFGGPGHSTFHRRSFTECLVAGWSGLAGQCFVLAMKMSIPDARVETMRLCYE